MPESPRLPTEDDLKKLTLRGVVAYAVRSAMRVRPFCNSLDTQSRTTVDIAIELAAAFAKGLSPANDTLRVTNAARVNAFGRTILNTAKSDPARTPGGVPALAAALAASAAADAANAGIEAAMDVTAEFVERPHFPAAESCVHAAGFGPTLSRSAFKVAATVEAAIADYTKLLKLAPGPIPKVGDPINLDSLGLLWHGDEPLLLRDALVRSRLITAAIPELHEVGPVSVVIAWDPELLSEDDYARLVVAIGDVAREEGSKGVVRLKSRGFGAPIGEGVLQP